MEDKKFSGNDGKFEMKVVGNNVKRESQKDSQQEGRYSYEELNRICSELHQQNQYLMKQLRQLDMSNMFKRLDYLFKVVETANINLDGSHYGYDSDFVMGCIAEIQDALSVPAESKEGQGEESDTKE